MRPAIPTIETQRLTLRTLQEAWRAIADWLGHWDMRGYGQWAIEEHSSGRFIGRAGIINPVDWPGPEVGYLLGKDWWGRGYATEAARAAIDWGFEHFGFDDLISLIDPANRPSIAVATRLGESLCGEYYLWGHTVLIDGISRAAWEARRP